MSFSWQMSLLVCPGDSAMMLRNLCATSNILPIICMQHHEYQLLSFNTSYLAKHSLYLILYLSNHHLLLFMSLNLRPVIFTSLMQSQMSAMTRSIPFSLWPPPPSIQDLISCLHFQCSGIKPTTGRNAIQATVTSMLHPTHIQTFRTIGSCILHLISLLFLRIIVLLSFPLYFDPSTPS